jgi:hypothetical protein
MIENPPQLNITDIFEDRSFSALTKVIFHPDIQSLDHLLPLCHMKDLTLQIGERSINFWTDLPKEMKGLWIDEYLNELQLLARSHEEAQVRTQAFQAMSSLALLALDEKIGIDLEVALSKGYPNTLVMCLKDNDPTAKRGKEIFYEEFITHPSVIKILNITPQG